MRLRNAIAFGNVLLIRSWTRRNLISKLGAAALAVLIAISNFGWGKKTGRLAGLSESAPPIEQVRAEMTINTFLDAIRAEDWVTACRQLTPAAVRELGAGSKGCEAMAERQWGSLAGSAIPTLEVDETRRAGRRLAVFADGEGDPGAMTTRGGRRIARLAPPSSDSTLLSQPPFG